MAILSDDTIMLRAPEPEDLDIFYRWENDTELWEYGVTLAPYSRYDLKKYLTLSPQDIYQHNQVRFMIERKLSPCTLGMIDLYDFDPHHSRAGVGIIIDKPFRNKHIASKALTLLTEYAFSFLHIHQLYAHIPVSNTPSLSLFGKNGFIPAGTLQQWIHTPEGYEDVCVMQKLSS